MTNAYSARRARVHAMAARIIAQRAFLFGLICGMLLMWLIFAG